MFTSLASTSGAVTSWLPVLTVMPADDAESSVSVLPASVYLLALLNCNCPTVRGRSTVTVCGAVMIGPNSATLSGPFGLGPALLFQLTSSVQLPSTSVLQMVGATDNLKLSR